MDRIMTLQAVVEHVDLGEAWMVLPEPALIFDETGRVLVANHTMAWLLGLPVESLRGQTLAPVLGETPGGQVERRWLLHLVRRQGQAEGFTLALRGPDGGLRWYEGAARRLGEAPPRRYLLLLHDVTSHLERLRGFERRLQALERKHAEQRRELARRVEELARANQELQDLDRARNELISLVSHQVRAPLTNMVGAVERMQTSCSAPTAVCSRMFTVLREQAERLSRLVDEVLDVARLESGDLALNLEPTSLMPVLQQAAEAVAARGNRPIRLPFAPVLPLVMADRERLLEVVTNLLDNADKYSPPEAEVRVEVRATEEEVFVSVIDTGPGLPPQDLERVFAKYYRAERGDAQRAYGYGLGLYICRRLIEAQGGRIWAANRPEGGAVFTFTLPVAKL